MSATLARFGPFEIVARLGVGGMGEVFLARRADDGAEVALKLIRPEFARDPSFRRMFANEARIGARLRHENLVRVVDAGELDGVPYLAMDYVDGVAVDRLVRDEPLPPAAAVAVVRPLLRGLAYAHELNLLHRDVSCSNVLVAIDGAVKLADFGIGRADDQTTTSTHAVKGKRAYLAPELLALGAGAYSRRSDLFACGVVLHRLVTAALPDDGAAVPSPFAALIERALAPDPLRRFGSAPEMLAAVELLAIADGEGGDELRRRVAAADRSPVALPMIDQLILAEMHGEVAPSQTVTAPRTPPSRPRRRIVSLAAIALGGALVAALAVTRAARHAQPAAPVVASPPIATPAPTPVPPIAPPAPRVAPPPPRAAPTKNGLLTLDSEPWGTVYLGSRRLGVTPFTRVSLPAGRHQLQLDVRNSGRRRSIEVNVIPDSELRLSVHLPAGATAAHRSSATPPQ